MFTECYYLFKIIFPSQFFGSISWTNDPLGWEQHTRGPKTTNEINDTSHRPATCSAYKVETRSLVTRCYRSVQYIYQCLFIHICHLDKFVLWRAWIYQYVSFTWFSYRDTILILQVFSKLKNNSRLYWSLFSNVRRSDKSEPFALQLGKSHHFQFF